MSFTVLAPGLYSLPVDLGRVGGRATGLPLGGAADRESLMFGNGLVGNEPAAGGLEITLAGPTLRAEKRIAAVLFGAPFEAWRNDQPLTPGTTFQLEPGDCLRVGGTPTGCRAYLCVPVGFPVSRSPAPLKAGDELACEASALPPRSLPPCPADSGVLRVLPGPQRDWFPDNTFFTHPFTVSAASNRMGVRLTGVPIPKCARELASEPVAPGAVQVTNDGLPVVLGVDGQTIGGYPKVAHVIRADLDKLGRLRPGDVVRFQQVTEVAADAAAVERLRRVRDWLFRLRVTAHVRHTG